MPLSLLDQVLPFIREVTEALEEAFYFPRGVEAADVVQEIALRFKTKLPVVHPQLEKYLPRLLKRACFNRAKDHWRAWTRYEPRHIEHQEDVHRSKERTPISKIVSQETREKILSRLTAEQIEAVKMIEEGYSIAEVAAKHGIGESAIRMRLHAARKRIEKDAA
jgi:RNA polymerase sigma factor (sigma-70 family)